MTFRTPEDERNTCRFCGLVLAAATLVFGAALLAALLVRGCGRGY